MKKLILVCGPAAIGKSTWSNGYRNSHPDEKVVIISADDLRCELYGSYRNFPPNNNMMLVYNEMINRASKLAEEILNRHETLKAYLIKLGVNEKIAEEDCCRIEHSISEETFLAISHELETKK